MTRYEDKYTLYFWNNSLNRFVKYCEYTTLKRLKHQINRYRENYKNEYLKGDWYIWKDHRPIDVDNTKYKIVHTRYKISRECVFKEDVNEDLH